MIDKKLKRKKSTRKNRKRRRPSYLKELIEHPKPVDCVSGKWVDPVPFPHLKKPTIGFHP